MRYYKDELNDIWAWSDDKQRLHSIYYNIINKWVYDNWYVNAVFNVVNSNEELVEVLETEVFLEMI